MSESGKVEDLLDLLVDLANEPKSNSSSEELQESEPETKPQLVDKSEKVNLIDKLDQVEKIDEVNRIEKLDTREKITKDNNLSASPSWLTEKTSNNNRRIDNKIVAVVPITDPELITQEMGRLDKLFNQLDDYF